MLVLVRSIRNFRYLPLITLRISFSSQRIIFSPLKRITFIGIHYSGVFYILEHLPCFDSLYLIFIKLRKPRFWINEFCILFSRWIESECPGGFHETVGSSFVKNIDWSIFPSLNYNIWIIFLCIRWLYVFSDHSYCFYSWDSLWSRGIHSFSTHLSYLFDCALSSMIITFNLDNWVLRLFRRRYLLFWGS